VVVAAFVVLFPPPAGAETEPPALLLSELPGEAELLKMLWERSPDLAMARAKVASARADLERAQKLPNPGLDVSWNTIPVGETNPPGMDHPLAHVPNYAFVLSELVEIAKRGPRQASLSFTAQAALWDTAETARKQLLDLLDGIGRVASSEQRIAVLEGLVTDAARLTTQTQKRAEKGDAATLDVDRARLEEEKLRSSLAEERQKLTGALVDCSRLAGTRCEGFSRTELAQAFLDTRSAPPPPAEARAHLDERPDLRSLSSQEASARAALELADAHLIPDPTVRFGFSYDTFLVSGNQGKSFNVGVSIPLPLFERGQADAAQASASAHAASRSRALLKAQAGRDLDRLLELGQVMARRRVTMRDETVPMARGVVERLTQALGAGGASLQDLLAARRTLGDLLEDSADLDLAAFEVALSIARTARPLPVAPGSLVVEGESR
jgi:cobalt-zinc-cadmium efflux system outer membrane protein